MVKVNHKDQEDSTISRYDEIYWKEMKIKVPLKASRYYTSSFICMMYCISGDDKITVNCNFLRLKKKQQQQQSHIYDNELTTSEL